MTLRLVPRSLAGALLTAVVLSVTTRALVATCEPLPRSTPEEQGVDAARLSRAAERLRSEPGTECLLVARHGRLVLERHFRGRAPGADRDVKSASKSILSALVGIAIERGELPGVGAPLQRLLPERARGVEPAASRPLVLEHLLTMTTGLASTSGEHYGAWVSKDDWVRAALARPVEAAPGERFTYSTGNTHLLGAILSEASGLDLRSLAEQRLFEPLGVEAGGWMKDPRGLHFGGNGLALSARDLLRFGQLYLQRGEWQGEQLVPASWVERSTRRHAEGWPERYGGYGFLWWLPGFVAEGSFMAVGYGGQLVLVSPRHELVVVLTSSVTGKGAAWDRRVLETFREGILGAVRHGDTRPSDDTGARGATELSGSTSRTPSH